LAAAARCTGVQLAAAHLPARSSSIVAQNGDALVLIAFGLPTAAIDWQIAVTWALPAWVPAIAAVLVVALIVTALTRPAWKAFAAAGAVTLLYALPVIGGILRWHLVASPRALISRQTSNPFGPGKSMSSRIRS